METRRDLVSRRGLPLPKRTWRRLASVGIYARPEVSLEYQQLARRYVVRGVESGGAIASIGRYVTFAGESGAQIAYLHTMNSVGVNGLMRSLLLPRSCGSMYSAPGKAISCSSHTTGPVQSRPGDDHSLRTKWSFRAWKVTSKPNCGEGSPARGGGSSGFLFAQRRKA